MYVRKQGVNNSTKQNLLYTQYWQHLLILKHKVWNTLTNPMQLLLWNWIQMGICPPKMRASYLLSTLHPMRTKRIWSSPFLGSNWYHRDAQDGKTNQLSWVPLIHSQGHNGFPPGKSMDCENQSSLFSPFPEKHSTLIPIHRMEVLHQTCWLFWSWDHSRKEWHWTELYSICRERSPCLKENLQSRWTIWRDATNTIRPTTNWP